MPTCRSAEQLVGLNKLTIFTLLSTVSGANISTESLFTLRTPEGSVAACHPLRSVSTLANAAFEKIAVWFTDMYGARTKCGQPGVAPGEALRAVLQRTPFGVRRKLHLTTRPGQSNLLFRCFIGSPKVHPIRMPVELNSNGNLSVKLDTVIKFFIEVLATVQEKGRLSSTLFSLASNLNQTRTGHQSLEIADGCQAGGDGVDFKGTTRRTDTHESKTDSEARSYCTGNKASELPFAGHTFSSARSGVVTGAAVKITDSCDECEAVKVKITGARQAERRPKREIARSAERGCDAQEFIDSCQTTWIAHRMAQNKPDHTSAVTESISQSYDYAVSQHKRKVIEQRFDLSKTVGSTGQVLVRGLKRIEQISVLTMAAYNLVRRRTFGQVLGKS